MKIMVRNEVHGVASAAADGLTFDLWQSALGDPAEGVRFSASQRYRNPALRTQARAYLHLGAAQARDAAYLRWYRDHAPQHRAAWFQAMLNASA